MTEERVVERKVLWTEGSVGGYSGEWDLFLTHHGPRGPGWRIVAERVEQEPSESERLARELERVAAFEWRDPEAKEFELKAIARLRETDPEKPR